MNWKNLLYTTTLFAMSWSTIQAQTATATLSGSDTVRQGDLLRLTFAFENVETKSFELPDLVGLTIVGGPSRQSSMRIMNGKRSSSSAFVYQVVAEQPGLAFVPEVVVMHENEEVKTESLKVFITEDAEYVPRQQGVLPKRTPPQAKKKKRPIVKM